MQCAVPCAFRHFLAKVYVVHFKFGKNEFYLLLHRMYDTDGRSNSQVHLKMSREKKK